MIAQRSRLSELSTNDQDILELNSSLWHKLYRSLDSGVIGRLYWQQAGERHTDRVQGNARFDYRKETAFGNLNLYYNPEIYVQDEYGNSGTTPIVGETHVYTPGGTLFLNNFGVDEQSVQIWNGPRNIPA